MQQDILFTYSSLLLARTVNTQTKQQQNVIKNIYFALSDLLHFDFQLVYITNATNNTDLC